MVWTEAFHHFCVPLVCPSLCCAGHRGTWRGCLRPGTQVVLRQPPSGLHLGHERQAHSPPQTMQLFGVTVAHTSSLPGLAGEGVQAVRIQGPCLRPPHLNFDGFFSHNPTPAPPGRKNLLSVLRGRKLCFISTISF